MRNRNSNNPKAPSKLEYFIVYTLLCMAILTLPLLVLFFPERERSYYVESTKYVEYGQMYEEYTDRICKVTEIDEKNSLVYVKDCNGDKWSFYGDSYKVKQKIICVFNDENEIVDVK